MSLIDKLNPMQKEAVLHTEGPLLLLAGAGSGKTRVLTHRIAHLIDLGVKPFHILAITFTNKAAKEMRARVDALVPEGSDVWVSTFHSLCVRILRRDIDKIDYDNKFSIYDSDDSEKLIKLCLKELNISDKQFPVRATMGTISNFKNELISPSVAMRDHSSDFRMKKMIEVYTLYQRKLVENNALDFDDIIFKMVDLLTARDDVREKYQDRFKYVMVDEYQDTNTAQYTLVRLLSGKYKNLCVVGDDDQSIYGWRGANIRNILDFEKDYKNAKVIKLEQNYRSTKTILDAANEVIKNNFARKAKSLWTSSDSGEKIVFNKSAGEAEEAMFVADKILNAIKNGAAHRDFAILYRTNAQSRIFEEVFIKRGVPHKILGGIRFYDRRVVRDLLAYLKFLNNPHDSIALMRIINVPRRGIGDASIDKVSEYAVEHGLSFFRALFEVKEISGLGARGQKFAAFRDLMEELLESALNEPIDTLIEKVINMTGYKAELEAEDTDEARDNLENLLEVLSIARSFMENAEDGSLSAFLEEVALVADIDGYNENDDVVVLMTLHSSKGLEFPTVFLVGFEEGLFPSYRSITSGTLDEIEEERRLCYVGITRAKEHLYITAASARRLHGQLTSNLVSRFFKEIPPALMDNKNAPLARTAPVKPQAQPSQKPSFGKAFSPSSVSRQTPQPSNEPIDFVVGDQVSQMKYGVGTVLAISPSGADFEVTIDFPEIGRKKFMAHLSRLKKVSN